MKREHDFLIEIFDNTKNRKPQISTNGVGKPRKIKNLDKTTNWLP